MSISDFVLYLVAVEIAKRDTHFQVVDVVIGKCQVLMDPSLYDSNVSLVAVLVDVDRAGVVMTAFIEFFHVDEWVMTLVIVDLRCYCDFS